LKIGVVILSLSVVALSGELSPEQSRTRLENQSTLALSSLNAFQELTQNLNQIAQKNQVALSIPQISVQPLQVSKSQVLPFASAKTPSASSVKSLPDLSVDKTQINLGNYGNLNNLIETAQDALKSQGLLAIPQARLVEPNVGEKWNSKQPLESPPSKQEAGREADVLTDLGSQNTRFGKDRYDKNPFQTNNEIQKAPLPVANNSLGFNSPPSSNSTTEIVPEAENKNPEEDPEIKKQKEARASFEKTMQEFAERTEEKESFQLVDYYDLRNVLSKNESLLNSYENDEIDERFVKNVQTIYERFGEKDNSFERRSLEKFLKRMQPPEPVFGSPSLRRQQNGIGRRPEVHQ